MTKKVYIANSDKNKYEYRLIVNINDTTSIGIKLTLSEIQQLQFELKEIIDSHQKMVKTMISV